MMTIPIDRKTLADNYERFQQRACSTGVWAQTTHSSAVWIGQDGDFVRRTMNFSRQRLQATALSGDSSEESAWMWIHYNRTTHICELICVFRPYPLESESERKKCHQIIAKFIRGFGVHVEFHKKHGLIIEGSPFPMGEKFKLVVSP